MTDWRCGECRAQVAPGAPRCPECPSTSFEIPEAEMLKITRDGTVSDSADVLAAEAAETAELADAESVLEAEPFHVEGGFAGPAGLEVLKVPAEGAAVEAPAVPVSVAPPRRTPPPAVPRE